MLRFAFRGRDADQPRESSLAGDVLTLTLIGALLVLAYLTIDNVVGAEERSAPDGERDVAAGVVERSLGADVPEAPPAEAPEW